MGENSPSWDRILHTCLKHDGTDAWLIAGSPPILRLRNSIRQLAMPPLTAEDILAMLHPILPAASRSKLDDTGRAWFDHQFRNAEWFRVNVLRKPSGTVVVLCRFSPEGKRLLN